MIEIHINKASVVGEGETPDTVIKIEGPAFEEPDMKVAERRFAEQGDAIERMLHNSLPGGTYCSLLAAMLKRRASHFVVSFGGKSDE